MYRNPFNGTFTCCHYFSIIWKCGFLPSWSKRFSYKKLFRFVSGALIGQTTPLVLELQCMNLVTALIWHTLLRALWVGDLMT